MRSKVKCLLRPFVILCLVELVLCSRLTIGSLFDGNVPDRLELSAISFGEYPARPLPNSVEWQGQEYDIESGIGVLMNVAKEPNASIDDRHYALLRLAMLDRRLRGRPCLDELRELYDHAEKLRFAVILCFKASDDPRAISLFIHVLDTEQDTKLRLSAAGGLAQWNIRRGVDVLVALTESEEMLPQPTNMPSVRDNAVELLGTKNRLKGWGMKFDEMQESIKTMTDLTYEQQKSKLINEIKKWWSMNEHRFPEWKPGDPLPEMPKPDGNASDGE